MLVSQAADLALVGARIYPGPDLVPLSNGTLIIHDGRIASIGGNNIKVPAGMTRIDCKGLTVTAGFWNCHVHFSENKWENASSIAVATLTLQLRDMFTRWGFTTVFDTGSDLPNTKTVARRINAGEVPGPMILSAGTPFTQKDATPYYLRPLKLPEFETVAQATLMVRARLDEGADAIKIFQGSWVTPEKIMPMPLTLVKAAAMVAHDRGKLLLAHPSDAANLRLALAGGIDVLTHLIEMPGDVDAAMVAEIKKRNIAVIPTLKLFSRNENLDKLLRQLLAYSEAGVPILFGTDVGFLTDYDPGTEYQLLDRAGLTFTQMLAALTTAPSAKYGFSQRKGRLAPGFDADLVVLAADPAEEILAFRDVRYTIQKGIVAYSSP